MRTHKYRLVTTMALLILVGVGLAPSTASAAPSDQATAVVAACSTRVDIGFTIKQGDWIRGSASYTKCNNEIYSVLVVLNEVRGALGVPVVRRLFVPAPYGAHSYGVAFNCAGRGVHTYYTQIVTHANTGQVTARKTSNKIRVDCREI